MRRTGFSLGILGVAIYVIGTFLPTGGTGTQSMMVVGPIYGIHHVSEFGLLTVVQLVLMYLWVPAIILFISIAGSRRDAGGRWAAALFAVSGLWFLQIVEELVYIARFPISLSWTGYVVTDLGLCVAFLGGVLALSSLRSEEPGSEDLSQPTPGVAVAGFALALGGALVFAVASFLPSIRSTFRSASHPRPPSCDRGSSP